MFFPLFCNDNNYMTYNWPNSAFFNFQENANQGNCRQYSCIIFLLTNWNKKADEEKIYRWTEFFHKLDNDKWKMHTGARARKQKYISIYISLHMKTFLKTGVYIYIYIYIFFPWEFYFHHPQTELKVNRENKQRSFWATNAKKKCC